MIRQAGTTHQPDQFQWMAIWAQQTATSASMLPTARSMPPEIITSVMPQARIP